MTLLQLSQEYAYSAELLSRRIAQLRREEAAAEGEDERFMLHRRILDLQPYPASGGGILRQELLPG